MATANGRRRGCYPPAVAAAYFPPDLIPEVARHLTSLEDFFALRSSCRAYRALLALTPSNLASQAPLVLLHHAATDSFALLHFPLRRLLRFRLPRTRLFDDEAILVRSHLLGCRVAIDCVLEKELRILHPLTDEVACLPRPPQNFFRVVLRGDLVLAWGYCGRSSRSIIQYCRLQDANWHVVRISGSYLLYDLIFVNDTLYALVTLGSSDDFMFDAMFHLAVVELSDDGDSVELALLGDELDAPDFHIHETSELYLMLARCGGDLILLSAISLDPSWYNVFRWKPEEAKWEKITSLGGFALFFTGDCFVGCLGPDHPGIVGDCIYVTGFEGYWGEYSSVDGSFRRSAPRRLGEELRGFASYGWWALPSMC